MSDVQRNYVYQESLELTNLTPANSLYLTTGGLEWIYLLYFFGRPAWDLHSLLRDPDHLDKEITRHLLMNPIFIQATALQNDMMKPRLLHFKMRPLGKSLPWLQLQ